MFSFFFNPNIDQYCLKVLLLLFNISVKGSIIILFIIFINYKGRNINPKLKHFITFLSICSFMVLPFVSMIFSFSFSGLFQTVDKVVYQNDSMPFVQLINQGILIFPSYSTNIDISLVQDFPKNGFSWSSGLFLLWIFGSITLFLRSIIGRIGLFRLTHTSKTCTNSRILNIFNEILSNTGIKREVHILTSKRCAVPMTYNSLKPVILLPSESNKWTQSRIKAVLIHELTHIKRFDYFTLGISRIVYSLFWFVPVIWIAYSIQKREQENICDSCVLNMGIKPVEYAEQLLDFLRVNNRILLASFISIPVVKKHYIEVRIRRILNQGGGKLRIKIKHILIMILLSLFSLTALGFVNFFSVKETAKEVLDKIKKTITLDKPTDILIINAGDMSGTFDIPVLWPISDGAGTIVENKNGVISKGHYLNDSIIISCSNPQLVLATADGIVCESDPFDLKEKHSILKIQHKNGIYSIYSDFVPLTYFPKGHIIKRGDVLGYTSVGYIKNDDSIIKRVYFYFYYAIQVGSEFIDPKIYLFGLGDRVYLSKQECYRKMYTF